MDQNLGTPIPPIEEMPPAPQKKSNTTLIILIVVLVVLCCCCVVIAAGVGLWFYGDQIFNIPSSMLLLPPV